MKAFVRLAQMALLVAGGGLMSARAEEAPQHPAKPLLWKIEGGDLKKPSYLFGTIHLATPPVGTLHPAAAKAFDAADVVYTEIPLDAASQVAAVPFLIRQDGKTLDEAIGPDLAKRLNEELKSINPALDSIPFQSFKVWGISVMLPLLPEQLKGGKALDAVIWENATKAGKQTAGLETVAFQMGVLDSFTEPEQITVLSETLRQLKEDREAGVNGTANLIAAYVSGEDAKIQAELDKSVKRIAESEHKELGAKFMKRFLADRDTTMAETIDKKLREAPDKTHFFAAGAAHFIATPGIGGHLTEKGWHVTRIND